MPEIVGLDKDPIGSVGPFVGAALETAGHIMQSRVLDMFEAGLAHSLGSFVYLLAAIIGILIVAIGGNYKYGLWFLFSPTVFFWLISARVESGGAEWKFGTEDYKKNEDKQLLLKDIQIKVQLGNSALLSEIEAAGLEVDEGRVGEEGIVKPARVSWFFAKWNKVTSATVVSFTSLLHLTNKHKELKFVNLAERYERLMNVKTSEPIVKYFIQIAMMNKCSDYFSLVRLLNNPAVNDVRKNEYRETIASLGAKASNFNVQEHPHLLEWLRNTRYNEEKTMLDRVKDIDAETSGGAYDGMLTCKALWLTAMDMTRKLAVPEIHSILRAATDSQESYRDALRQIEKKMLTEVSDGDQVIKGADEHCEGVEGECAEPIILLVNEVAARMLFREFNEVNPNIAQLAYDKHPALSVGSKEIQGSIDNPENLGGFATVENPDNLNMYTSHAIRSISETEQFQGKGDFLTAMLSLPYIQGLVLYWLSIAFPFFCVAILVPGRHYAILLWMSLWFWVKSWDFGIAIVMMVDQMLFALLPHGPPITAEVADSPEETFKNLMQIDPTYSVHTYYNLVATCIAAVPIITGAMVKGGGQEVMHAVNQGFQNFSGKIGGAMASFERASKGQSDAAQVQKNILGAVQRELGQVLSNEKIAGQLNTAIAASAGAKSINGLAQQLKKGNLSNEKLNQVLSKLQEDGNKMVKGVAMAQIKERLSMAAFKESQSLRNRELAIDARRNKYYSHDFARSYPAAASLNVLTASVNFQTSAFNDKLMGPAGKAVNNQIMKNLYPKEKAEMERRKKEYNEEQVTKFEQLAVQGQLMLDAEEKAKNYREANNIPNRGDVGRDGPIEADK